MTQLWLTLLSNLWTLTPQWPFCPCEPCSLSHDATMAQQCLKGHEPDFWSLKVWEAWHVRGVRQAFWRALRSLNSVIYLSYERGDLTTAVWIIVIYLRHLAPTRDWYLLSDICCRVVIDTGNFQYHSNKLVKTKWIIVNVGLVPQKLSPGIKPVMCGQKNIFFSITELLFRSWTASVLLRSPC